MVPADPVPNDKAKRRPSRPSTAGTKRRSKPAAASSPAKARPPGKSKAQGSAPKRARRNAGRAPVPMVWEPVQAQTPAPAARPSRSPPILWDPIQPQRRPAIAGRMVLIGFLVFALALMGMASQVTSAPNTGTIKVHDGATADPASRNEPHVTGDFFVEGSNMAEDGGALFIFSWPPTGTKELVVDTTWDADEGTPSFHFLAGPLTLPCGHYRVGASNGPAEPEDFPAMKSKGFWIDCAEEPEEPEPTPTPGPTTSTTTTSPPTSTTTTSGGPEEPEEPTELACPTGLQATALDNGDVRLDWTPAAGSDGSNVYRAVGDGDFEYVTTVAAGVGTYLDDTTVVGQGYAYTVSGLFGDEEAVDCPLAETTAIPEFPTALGIGLAAGGGLLALALAGRRKL